MLTAWVDHRCGLLGDSGIAGDMRLLHAAGAAHADAQLAIAVFFCAVRKQIAAMVAARNLALSPPIHSANGATNCVSRISRSSGVNGNMRPARFLSSPGSIRSQP